jgi:diaminopimelate epimerase
MRFTKMHGLGNDFLVVDDRAAADADWSALARQLCDRRRGVGADGILLIGSSTTCDLRMRLFNADGTEAEMCGNGVRCVAQLAQREGFAGDRVIWETGAGPVGTEVLDPELVRVDMGPPRFAAADIPVHAAGVDPLRLKLEAAGRRLTVAATPTRWSSWGPPSRRIRDSRAAPTSSSCRC